MDELVLVGSPLVCYTAVFCVVTQNKNATYFLKILGLKMSVGGGSDRP